MATSTQLLRLDPKTYRENEIDANVSLIRGCVFTGVVLAVIWCLYIFELFNVSSAVYRTVNVIFPMCIALMASTVILGRTTLIKDRRFKYLLLGLYLFVIAVLNVFIPKHATLGWALMMILTAHYYSPKTTWKTFFIVLVFMLACLYLGMFFGEWDANLMNGGGLVYVNGKMVKCDYLTIEERWQYLHDLIYNPLPGLDSDNRYLKVFAFYFSGRAVVLAIITYVTASVTKRTETLLVKESLESKENQKMTTELTLASSIQNEALSKDFPDNRRESIYAIMSPAKEVGGDFYDYFYIDEQRIGIVIGDVSGKGVPASLYMMTALTLLKSLATEKNTTTSKVMEKLNVALCKNNSSNMFITCWFGVIDYEKHLLKYTNAGHDYPLIFANGEFSYLKGDHSVPLATFESAKFKENSVEITDYTKILLYTDGVTEAQNNKEELYGEMRLLDFVNAHRDYNSKEMVEAIHADINRYQGEGHQFDDITMLMINIKKGMLGTNLQRFAAQESELEKVQSFIQPYFEKHGVDFKTLTILNVAVEEVFVNISSYAYANHDGYCYIEIQDSPNEISLTFFDKGVEFNPLEKEDPDIHADPNERRIGGLGIYMIKQIFDDVSYSYEDKSNILTLVKKFN